MVAPLWACILYFLFSWFLKLFWSWIYLTDRTNKELKIYPSFLYVSIFQYEFLIISKFSLWKGVGEKGYRVGSKAWHQDLWMQWGKQIPQMKLLKRTIPWMKMLERIAVFLYFIMQSCTTICGSYRNVFTVMQNLCVYICRYVYVCYIFYIR